MSPQARGYAAYPAGHAEGYPDTFVQLFKDLYGYIAAGDFQALRSFPTFKLAITRPDCASSSL